MNADVITLNECKNDGTFLHLYFDKPMNVWAAYGLSAYKLRLFGKSNGCNNLREFSKELQMPCTIVGDRKSTRLNSSHDRQSRMPSSA